MTESSGSHFKSNGKPAARSAKPASHSAKPAAHSAKPSPKKDAEYVPRRFTPSEVETPIPAKPERRHPRKEEQAQDIITTLHESAPVLRQSPPAQGNRFKGSASNRGAAARSDRTKRPASSRNAGRTRKDSRRKKRDTVSTIMICIGLLLLLAAGGLFAYVQFGYKQASDYYDGINEQVLEDKDGIPRIDWAALRKISDDIVGWIYIPDTRINYVVVQGETNNQYLRRLPNGEYNQNGTVFMDENDTAPGMIDQQTTLYGHHMDDGSMFEFIDQTADQKVFDTVDEVYYLTEGKTYVLKPLFTMVVQDNYLDARVPNFKSVDDLHQYLSRSLEKAPAKAKDASKHIKDVDRVLTLITCAGNIIPRTTRAAMVCEVIDSY